MHPKTRRTSLASSSGIDSDEKRLRLDTAPLMDVRGAEKKAGGDDSPRLVNSRLCIPEVCDGLHPRVEGGEHPRRLVRQRRRGVAQHLRAPRERRRVPRLRRPGHDAGPGAQVQEGGQDRGATDAVENGVMHLGEQRGAAPVQPFDHEHLPQRAIGVERAAHGGGHERIELGPAPRCGEAGPGEVVVQFEIRVVDPHRMVEPERHPQRPAGAAGRPDGVAAR